MICILAVPFLLYIVGAVIACIGLHDEATRELTEEEAAAYIHWLEQKAGVL